MNYPALASATSIVAIMMSAGCATKKDQEIPPPQDSKDVDVYIEEIPFGSTADVRTGDVVKAYPIARYVDPADKRMMHERHVLYRLERPSRWRLKTPAGRNDAVLLGPVAGVRAPYYKPSPLSSEVARELRKQEEKSRQIMQTAENLKRQAYYEIELARQQYTEAQNLLSAQATATSQARKDAKEAAKRIEELEERIKDLEEKPVPTPVPQRQQQTSPARSSTPAPGPLTPPENL